MAECTGLYTGDELKDLIKNIDLELNSAISKSELDTGQSRHNFSVSVRTLREQREYYMSLLKRVDPACYHTLKGPSVIKFGGPRC